MSPIGSVPASSTVPLMDSAREQNNGLISKAKPPASNPYREGSNDFNEFHIRNSSNPEQNPYRSGSDDYYRYQTQYVESRPATQRGHEVASQLNRQGVPGVRQGGLSENGKVNGPGFATPPVITDVIGVFDALRTSNFEALEPSIQAVNGTFNEFATLTGHGSTQYDRQVGPDWGPSLANELGMNNISFRTFHDTNLSVGVSAGSVGFDAGQQFRRGYSVGLPYVKLDAEGNPKSYISVKYQNNSEAGGALSLSKASDKGGLTISGAAEFDQGIEYGLKSEWPFNSKTQRYEPPSKETYDYKKQQYVTEIDQDKTEVYHTSYGDVSASGSSGADLVQALSGVHNKLADAGKFNDPRTGAKNVGGVSAKLSATGRVGYGAYTEYGYKLSNPEAAKVLKSDVVIANIPLLGHISTGFQDALGYYDRKDQGSLPFGMIQMSGSLAGSYNPAVTRSNGSKPGAFGVGASDGLTQQLMFNLTPQPHAKTNNYGADRNTVHYFAKKGEANPSLITVANQVYEFDYKTGKAQTPRTETVKNLDVTTLRPIEAPTGGPTVEILGRDPNKYGPLKNANSSGSSISLLSSNGGIKPDYVDLNGRFFRWDSETGHMSEIDRSDVQRLSRTVPYYPPGRQSPQ
jgi:hypothetical protein